MERVGRQEDLEANAAALGYTPYEILIIASMIEREAKLPRTGRRSPASSTTGSDVLAVCRCRSTPRCSTTRTRTLSIGELRQIDTPYNTYLHTGLPPTPIANPGRASIHAALNPAPNPPPGDPICHELPDPTNCPLYFYVLANEDGGHAFAVTLEQHEAQRRRRRAAGLLG